MNTLQTLRDALYVSINSTSANVLPNDPRMHSICNHYETPTERLGTRDAHLDIASWMEQWQECARMQALKASRPTILLGSQQQHVCFMQELMSNSSWSVLDITVQMESGHTNAQALNNKKIFRIFCYVQKSQRMAVAHPYLQV